MRKWPFKEGSERSAESAAFLELVLQHEISGPERTRAWQLAGHPAKSRFSADYVNREPFDGTRECDCILDVFVCRDHKLAAYRLVNPESTGEPPFVELSSSYEQDYNMPFTRYPLVW